jgi:uncharacterized protein YyaL (SSP411 family)
MTNKFVECIRNRILVNTVVVQLDPGRNDWILGRNELLREVLKIPSGGKPFVTICQGYSCGAPIRDVESLDAQL